MRVRVSVGAALLVATLGLAACSSSSKSTGTSPTSSGGSSGPAASSGGFSAASKSAAQQLVSQYSAFPTAPQLQPLGKTPPKGRLVVFITCPLPACTPFNNGFQAGAAKLGWHSKVIVANFTPDGYVSAWQSALALKPNGIAYITEFPDSTVQAELAQAKAAGIWVVQSAPGPADQIGGGSAVSGAVEPVQRVKLLAQLQAALMVADGQPTDGLVFMYAPEAPSYVYAAQQFSAYIKAAGGTPSLLPVSQNDIGTKIPQEVVSYLQSHPNTRYLAAVDDTLFPGVAEAIKAAGITSPKLIGGGIADPTVVARIKNGEEYATVTGDLVTDAWNAIDIMARLSVGETPSNNQPLGVIWIVTKNNAAQFPSVFPGVPDAYTTAWGVS